LLSGFRKTNPILLVFQQTVGPSGSLIICAGVSLCLYPDDRHLARLSVSDSGPWLANSIGVSDGFLRSLAHARSTRLDANDKSKKAVSPARLNLLILH
jgi:hypothetical protein